MADHDRPEGWTDRLLGAVPRVASVIVGLAFVVAAGFKVVGPWDFLVALNAYGVPSFLRLPVVFLMPALEAVVGVALIAGWRPRIAGSTAAVLMVVFIAAIGYGMWFGELVECGCFGPLAERSPPAALAQDVVLLVLAMIAWQGSEERSLESWRPYALTGLALVAVTATGFAYVSEPPALESATGAADRAPDARSIDLQTGEYLLFLFHPQCPHCNTMGPRVASYLDDPSLPPVVGVTFQATRDEIDDYRNQHSLSIPVRTLPPRSFVSITGDGAVPQIAFVRDGHVVRVWRGELPTRADLATSLPTS